MIFGAETIGWPAFALAAGFGAASLAFGTGFYFGVQSGRQQQMADTVAAYQKRGKIDADVGSRDDYQLCLDLGGLPDQCNELRRVDPAASGE